MMIPTLQEIETVLALEDVASADTEFDAVLEVVRAIGDQGALVERRDATLYQVAVSIGLHMGLRIAEVRAQAEIAERDTAMKRPYKAEEAVDEIKEAIRLSYRVDYLSSNRVREILGLVISVLRRVTADGVCDERVAELRAEKHDADPS